MDAYSNVLNGSCHCKNVQIELHTNKEVSDFVPRTCQCDLCKKHGASWISDPEGEAKLVINDRTETEFYRFGHKTSDFVLCKKCGVLPIALCELEGKTKAVLNIKSIRNENFTASETLTNFDDEDVEGRLARRTKNWTSKVIIEG